MTITRDGSAARIIVAATLLLVAVHPAVQLVTDIHGVIGIVILSVHPDGARVSVTPSIRRLYTAARPLV